jgi:autotransporter-associated beta strand protein
VANPLGALSGPLTFNAPAPINTIPNPTGRPTFQFGANFDLASTRAITINPPGGTFDTQGFTSTIAQGMTGAGTMTKAGSGILILTGANTYGAGAGAVNTTIGAGTLQLGNGGATGSIVGNVAVALGSVLAFNRSDVAPFPGVVSGAGSLEQNGAGTTILTANNTYTGGTTINAGTLQLGDPTVNGGTTGSIIGNVAVAQGGTLAFNRTDVVTFPGLVSGTGHLAQIGSGTTILTADNTYSGGTTISLGTLQIGNGGVTGAVGSGPILDNAALVFNRSGRVPVPGAITGIGSLEQRGAAGGTVVLTGENTYSGGTTITAGTLQLGNGGPIGSIINNVVNEGTLAFNRSDNVTFGGLISGGGAVTQIGSGTTVLTNDNTYTGGTTITLGTLQLGNGGPTGSILGNVAVAQDAVLAFNRDKAAAVWSRMAPAPPSSPPTTVIRAAHSLTVARWRSATIPRWAPALSLW